MSDPKSVPFGKDLYCQDSTPSNEDQEKPASSVVMLNGVAVPTTYADKCRLCLGDKFDKNSTSIIEEECSRMLDRVFSIPITNKIGLPMNVCSKCYRKVRLFYQYSTTVINNQMKMEESLLSVAALLNKNNSSTPLAPAQNPDTTPEEEIEEVIDIASDDESSKEREDETMDADLPSVTITADARNDPLVEPPDIEDAAQTHFVSVATQDDYLFYNEVDGIETFDTPHTDFIEEVVIELVSSNDDESDVGSEAENQNNNNRRKNAKRVVSTVPETQSFTETRLQAKVVAAAMKNVNNSKRSKR